MAGTGNGFNSTVLTANTAGIQVMAVGGSNAQALNAPLGAGFLHAINMGADSTAVTLSIYDGSSTSGTLKFKTIMSTSWPQSYVLDIQFNVGMFVVISGGTTPTVNLSWA